MRLELVFLRGGSGVWLLPSLVAMARLPVPEVMVAVIGLRGVVVLERDNGFGRVGDVLVTSPSLDRIDKDSALERDSDGPLFIG